MKSRDELIAEKMILPINQMNDVLGKLPERVDAWGTQTKAENTDLSLWMYGAAGTGKTTIAHKRALEIYKSGLSIAENGYQVLEKEPRPVPFMVYSLCRAFQDASLENRDYEPQNFLYIIDDADKVKFTDFREEQFFIFFDRCLKLKRKLIVTSQKNMKGFSEMFSGDFIGAVNRRLDALFKEVEL